MYLDEEPDFEIHSEWMKWRWAVMLKGGGKHDEILCDEMSRPEATDLETHLMNFLPIVFRGDGWTQFVGLQRPATMADRRPFEAGAIRLLHRVRSRLADLALDPHRPEGRWLRSLESEERVAVEALRATGLVFDRIEDVRVVRTYPGTVLDKHHVQVAVDDPAGLSLHHILHSPDQHLENDSHSWLALQVLFGGEELRAILRDVYGSPAAVASGAADAMGRAIARALIVGQAVQAAIAKKSFEGPFLRQRFKTWTLQARNRSRRGKKEPQGEKDAEALAEIMRTNPSLSKDRAAELVGKKRNVTGDAVLKAISRIEK
ncbi:MAG: hypothetical protein KIT43_14485 [Bauldia sp.]|nr:hypothetical protein [Bauldia sp.]MCW5716732.1 hypothetical protein [Bauldia sp.]